MKRGRLQVLVALALAMSTHATVASAVPSNAVLLVSSYSTSPDNPILGEPFEVRIRVTNIGRRDAKHVLVTIEPSASKSGSLASLGTGNVKKIEVVPGQGARTVTFRMAADPGGTPGVVPLDVSLSTVDGRVRARQQIGLRLRRKVILDVGGLSYPPQVQVGDSFTLAAEVLNSGNHAVSGMKVGARAEGATVAGSDYLVGVLQPGDVESIERTIVATSPGTKEISVVAEYRDDFGQLSSVRKTFQVTAVEPSAEPTSSPRENSRDSGGLGSRIAAFFRRLLG